MSLLGSQTNTTIPGLRREWLSRKRLLDLLRRLAELKLVLIAAPPGYGKTALLVDFASRSDLPVCWLGLDPLDLDPRRFLVQFIAAIRRQFPTFGQETLPIVMGDPAARLDKEIITTLLANDVAASISGHFFLILDDLQFVEAGDTIISILNGFIERVGENCHLILASRALPSLPCLPRMAASMQVGGISFEELSFQADEIQALLLLNNGIKIPISSAEELAQESEGWITGLILSIQSNPVGGADQLRLARVSGVGLFEYLAQQVLDIQRPEVRDFLLRSAYLEEFNAEFCQAVFGISVDWSALIAQVVHANLFILTIGDGGRWYRYNLLFKRFLQETLARENPKVVTTILADLEKVYRSRQDWEKAYQVLCQQDRPEALADLIEEAGPFLARTGHLTTLSSWIDSLPPRLIGSRPALTSMRGIVKVMLGEVETGLELLDEAVDRYRLTEAREELAITLTRRTLGRIFRGDFQGALSDAGEAYEWSISGGVLDHLRAEALRAKGLSLLYLDRNQEAAASLEEALRLYKDLDDPDKVGQTHIDLGFANSLLGRYREALKYYEMAFAHWDKVNNLVHQATVLNNMGVLLHAQGDFLAAGLRFDEALLKARRSGYRRAESLTLTSIGDIYNDLDDIDAASDAYQQAREVASRGELKSLLNYIDLAEAILAFKKGDEFLAFELLSLVHLRVKESASEYDRGLVGLRGGQLYLLNQDPAEAISELRPAVTYFKQGGRKAELAQASLLLAEAYFEMDEVDLAFECIAQTLAATRQLDSDNFLLPSGRLARGVLAAFERGPRPGAYRLLEKINDFEASLGRTRRSLRRQGSIVQVSPPYLAIKALGEGVIVRDGTLLSPTAWRSLTAREMFYCLLTHPDGLAKESLGGIFWPEASEEQVKVNFKNTLYRLRLSLGKDVVSFEAGKYSFNDRLDYWYDVKEFLGIVREDKPEAEAESRIGSLQRAISLYEGDFLPEMDQSWVVIEREHLRQAFITAGLTLGELLLEKGAFETALGPGLHLLSLDPYFEGAHRLLMRAHAGMGNRAAVMRQFDRCRDALWGEFQTAPSRQTISLFESLTR